MRCAHYKHNLRSQQVPNFPPELCRTDFIAILKLVLPYAPYFLKYVFGQTWTKKKKINFFELSWWQAAAAALMPLELTPSLPPPSPISASYSSHSLLKQSNKLKALHVNGLDDVVLNQPERNSNNCGDSRRECPRQRAGRNACGCPGNVEIMWLCMTQ